VILVDTGPLVGLFDPRDEAHSRCRNALARHRRRRLYTTLPVLTEAFHLLSAGSRGAAALREFITAGAIRCWFLDDETVDRAFELMKAYADQPMDLADASLVVAAERLGTRRVLTLDRRDFETYRVLRGHRRVAFQVDTC
jgi:predicted nucleic acid-binding protein